VVLLLLLSFGSWVYADDKAEYGSDVKERTLIVPKCDKVIGKIVAKEFRCKAGGCNSSYMVYDGRQIAINPEAIGQGMSDMILSALTQSGCFDVYERESLGEVQDELRMEGKSPQGLKGADFILTGAITAFEMNSQGGGGGGGVGVPFFGHIGVRTHAADAHVGLDLRVIRVSDAKILVSKTIEGKASRSSFGVGGGGWVGGVHVGGWFDSFKNTPIEEAIRDMLAKGIVVLVDGLKSQNLADLVSSSTPDTSGLSHNAATGVTPTAGNLDPNSNGKFKARIIELNSKEGSCKSGTFSSSVEIENDTNQIVSGQYIEFDWYKGAQRVKSTSGYSTIAPQDHRTFTFCLTKPEINGVKIRFNPNDIDSQEFMTSPAIRLNQTP